MPRYRVVLTGRNIVREVEGIRELMGFTAERMVDAADPDHAGEYALELLQEDPFIREPLNGPDDPFPVVLVDSVEEMDLTNPP
ncbi:MAG: hypothetical protein ABI679_02865 [Gemmatimonadota bacterium]